MVIPTDMRSMLRLLRGSLVRCRACYMTRDSLAPCEPRGLPCTLTMHASGIVDTCSPALLLLPLSYASR